MGDSTRGRGRYPGSPRLCCSFKFRFPDNLLYFSEAPRATLVITLQSPGRRCASRNICPHGPTPWDLPSRIQNRLLRQLAVHLPCRVMETWGFGVKAVPELVTSFCSLEGFLMLGVLSQCEHRIPKSR